MSTKTRLALAFSAALAAGAAFYALRPSVDEPRDYTLQVLRFDRLKLGMNQDGVRNIVGFPEFTRWRGNEKEHIYVLAGPKYNTYNFVKLSYSDGKLIRGVYEKAIDSQTVQ